MTVYPPKPPGDEPKRASPRELYDRYAAAVAYVDVRLPTGDRSMGTAFHVGEGVFVTARHVVENVEIEAIATTVDRYEPNQSGLTRIAGREGRFDQVPAAEGRLTRGPFFHPDDSIDVAAFVVEGINCPSIPLGGHLDDWIDDDAFLLAEVLVLGYPPIPLSGRPVLLASRGEVNAVIDKYTGGHPHFIVSAMARGGFSGGPCLVEWGLVLGVVTEALSRAAAPTELGYLAAISVEPIYVCLAHHGILPACQKEGWDGLWDDRPAEPVAE